MKRVKPKSSGSESIKTTIRIKRDLWKKIMHRSIDEDRSLQEILEISLENYLKSGEGRK
jgi:hypothetical protein